MLDERRCGALGGWALEYHVIAVSIVCVSLELSIFLSKIRQGVLQKIKIAHFSFAA
jgi:hypothetical protein